MKEINYQEILVNLLDTKKKLSILIFDEVWLSKFPKEEKNNKINSFEKKLKLKIIEESKLIEENKILKQRKNTHLKEILLCSEKIQNNLSSISLQNTMEELQKRVIDINEKLKINEEKLDILPNEIQNLNLILLEETIKICYNLIHKNEEEIKNLDPKIEKLKNQLRLLTDKRIALKDAANSSFNLLHDIVGYEVMDYLDSSFQKYR